MWRVKDSGRRVSLRLRLGAPGGWLAHRFRGHLGLSRAGVERGDLPNESSAMSLRLSIQRKEHWSRV